MHSARARTVKLTLAAGIFLLFASTALTPSQVPENKNDPSGIRIPYPRVRLIHSTDVHPEGATAFLRAFAPYLFYQLGRHLVQRQFVLADGSKVSEGGEASTLRGIYTLASDVHLGLQTFDPTQQRTARGGAFVDNRLHSDFRQRGIGLNFYERRYDGSLQREHRYLQSLVLYTTDEIGADINRDGLVSERYSVAGRYVGYERFDARFLFAVAPRYKYLHTVKDCLGREIPLSLIDNVAETYRLNLLYRRDEDGDGFPDVLGPAPFKRGARR